jgi:hypothetical protein
MLPVPAKSSETRAILLLIAGIPSHVWIQVRNVFVKSGNNLKMGMGIELLRSKVPVLQRPFRYQE